MKYNKDTEIDRKVGASVLLTESLNSHSYIGLMRVTKRTQTTERSHEKQAASEIEIQREIKLLQI